MLRRAFRSAALQTRPPDEVVVVDASSNWEEGKAKLLEEVARWRDRLSDEFTVTYVQGERASSAAQRNQAILLSTADVLFLMDDDTLIYPDCAEKLMEVYEADVDGKLQSVVPLPMKEPPSEEPGEEAAEPGDFPSEGTVIEHGWIVSQIRKSLHADERFIPYDRDYPTHELPGGLERFPLRTRQVLAGYCLTCRREAALREPFESRLERYSPGEDSDMTHRMNRHGPLVARLDAKICHLEAAGARLNDFPRIALGAINPLLLHRKNSSDLELSRARNRGLLRRRLIIEGLKDLKQRRLNFPQARGIFFALRQLDKIMSSSDEEFAELFGSYQRRFTGQG